MLYTDCTVHDGTGGRCGRRDICSLVRTYTVDDVGETVLAHEHRVCFNHRLQMNLPEADVALTPASMVEIDDRPVIAAQAAANN